MTHPEVQLFEAHVTIEPVYGERFSRFDLICRKYGFKAAELLMQKMRLATPERSTKDSFCTGHSRSYEKILADCTALSAELTAFGFKVWRYEIEGIVTDVKFERLVTLQPVERLAA